MIIRQIMQWTSSNEVPWSQNRYIVFIKTAEMIPLHPSALAVDEITDAGRGYVYGHMTWGPDFCNPSSVSRMVWQQNEAETLLYFADRYGSREVYDMWRTALAGYADVEKLKYLTEEELKASQDNRPLAQLPLPEKIVSEPDDDIEIELID